MNVDVSICFVSYKARDLLRDCLRSIYETIDSVSFEIIVVDNHSEDGALNGLHEKYPALDLHIHRLSSNLGFAAANNIGARLARGRWLALLNAGRCLPRTRLA